jgi:hypothetical protein
MNYIKKFNESNNTPKHDITDEFGYWWKDSLIKSIVGKTVEINNWCYEVHLATIVKSSIPI